MPRQSCHSSSFPPLSSFPRKRESRPQTRQESIGKNRNPRRRHSRAGGNLDPKRGRNLSEKTETPAAVIPAKAGIQTANAAGIYRKKQKPPPPSFPRKRESRPQTRQESIGKNRNPRRRHSRAGGNPDPKRGRNLSEKTETPAAVIPAQAGIQTPNSAGIYRKRLKPNGLDSRLRGNDGGRGFGIPAFAGMTESGGNNERRE
ncbi:putative phage associated protein [Neisseria meningitidis]|uniref:Putative phage associated protein n=1 Tax=Neisseria meningitidis TaxID=487 RepID=A0A378VP78_NEIME|nr:putative phage associated protein [Neisseria meningitidis]